MVAEDQETRSIWIVTLLVSLLCLLVLAVLVTFSNGWLHDIWFNYGWSSDKGNGPEALQQTVLYALIAAVLVPAVRRFIRREFHRAHVDIHAKLDGMIERNTLLHAKVDHVIKHTKEIPDFHAPDLSEPGPQRPPG